MTAPFKTLVRKSDPLRTAWKSAKAGAGPTKARRLEKYQRQVAAGTMTTSQALIAMLDVMLGVNGDYRAIIKPIHGASLFRKPA